ncbi:MAG: hypothetical protein EOO29_01170 [Comamonadaceae bacterium]|nr:MAG: hypothetical protein EOO29_01170 [Comamonadaceae bacterium]
MRAPVPIHAAMTPHLPAMPPPNPHPGCGRIAVVGSFMQAQCWLAPRLPMLGESMAATGFWTAPAGKGLAVAVGCRRLGAAVDLLLAIGDDDAGDALLQRLDAEGLHANHVRRYAGPSGQGAGWLAADGSNAILAFTGANACLDARQVARADGALAQADVVYAQFEAPVQAAREAFVRARRGGACTVLNPSPWQALDAELLAHTQVLLLNEAEAQQLLAAQDKPPPTCDDAQAWSRAAAAFWPTWPGDSRRRLVLTLAGRGCLALAPEGDWDALPALRVPVHSSIGAGDAFAAGLCTALAEGRPLHDALRRATACGAFAVQQDGILEGLPRASELAELLSHSEPRV